MTYSRSCFHGYVLLEPSRRKFPNSRSAIVDCVVHARCHRNKYERISGAVPRLAGESLIDNYPQTRLSAVTAKSSMAAYATDAPSIRHGVPYRRGNVEAGHDTALQAAQNCRIRLRASLSDGQGVCAPTRANRLYPGQDPCPGYRQICTFPGALPL